MTVYMDGPENLHPYECDGPGRCMHCDRRFAEDINMREHDPATCALCDPYPGHDGSVEYEDRCWDVCKWRVVRWNLQFSDSRDWGLSLEWECSVCHTTVTEYKTTPTAEDFGLIGAGQ